MANTKTTNNFATGAAQTAKARRARQSGIDAIYSEGAAAWAGIGDLHGGLLGSFIDSQRREADRLETNGKLEPMADAVRNAEMTWAVGGDLARLHTASRQIVESIFDRTVFQGYVWLPDGEPAVEYAVIVVAATSAGQRARLLGRTDSAGHFRISIAELNASTLAATEAEAARPEVVEAASTQPHSNPTVSVEVQDSAGRPALRDPEPPDFLTGRFHFRIYSLGAD